jgi:2,4-dienoyl-CoA reductase-like NADH-dependent reductase (Old Yellow Enzyme family)
MTKYPHVFESARLGPVEVRNRFYFGPHGVPTQVLSAGARPSEDFVEYYRERAAGGVGLFIHSVPAFPRASFARHCPYPTAAIPAFRAVADAVHEHGAKVFAQLHFSQTDVRWEPRSPAAPWLGVSANAYYGGARVLRAMSKDDIARFLEAHRRSTRNLVEAGYDGIEIHGTHAMTAEQFLSPYYNKRTDEYGGDFDNRLRFVVELLEAVREAAGGEVAVGIRYNCDELVPGGLTAEDTRQVLARLAELALVDFIDLDVAIEPSQVHLGMPSYFYPPLFYEPYVASVREAAGAVPVLSSLGRVTDLADAERAIAEGVVDLVGAVRPLLAEPNLVRNAETGQEHRSRKCIGANLCLQMGKSGSWGCAINPSTGQERRWGGEHWSPAARQERVVVVGAGPAGLEAARVAALRGHAVLVLERSDRVGGQLNLWAALPGREVVGSTPTWYEARLQELGVEVRTGVDAGPAEILAESPGTVILATGSTYSRTGESGFVPLPIPGADGNLVLTPEQILRDGARPTGTVVILDDEGVETGVGIAEVLAVAGADVHLVTSAAHPGIHLVTASVIPPLLSRLRKLDVTLHSHAYVRRIGERAVTLYDIWNDGDEQELSDVSAVVLVTKRDPSDALAVALAGKTPHLYAIGDALAPRGLTEAIYEGHRFARLVGEPGAPATFEEAYWTHADLAPYAQTPPAPSPALARDGS